jgi:hypothetical protein
MLKMDLGDFSGNGFDFFVEKVNFGKPLFARAIITIIE